MESNPDLSKIFDEDENDSSKDDEIGDYDEHVLARAVIHLEEKKRQFLERWVPKVQEVARKQKVPAAMKKSLKGELLDPLEGTLRRYKEEGIDSKKLLDDWNAAVGTNIQLDPDREDDEEYDEDGDEDSDSGEGNGEGSGEGSDV